MRTVVRRPSSAGSRAAEARAARRAARAATRPRPRPRGNSGSGGGRNTSSAIWALTSTWERKQPGELAPAGKFWLELPEPVRYAPLVFVQLGFLPFLFSYAFLPGVVRAGFDLPALLATVTAWAWAKVSSLGAPAFLGRLGSLACRALDLAAGSPTDVMWGRILHTTLPLMPVLYFFAVVPALDLFIGRDGNKDKAGNGKPTTSRRGHSEFRVVLWASAIIYITMLPLSCAAAAAQPLLATITIGVGLGMYGASQFAVAHELLHSPLPKDRSLSWLLLVYLFYPHYERSHRLIHHVRVGTPEDPSTARRGQGFYNFFVRSVVENWTEMQKIEESALVRASWIAGPSLLGLSLLAALGPKALGVYLLASFVSVLSLELVNYIEHYGLMRKKVNGKYEQVGKAHSWNADFFWTNMHIINLQVRHLDPGIARRPPVLRDHR